MIDPSLQVLVQRLLTLVTTAERVLEKLEKKLDDAHR